VFFSLLIIPLYDGRIIFENEAGHDVKSLVLNLSSILLIFLPGAMYFYPTHRVEEMGVVLLSFVIAIFLPPFGWMRPHPYSDKPSNTPYLMTPSGSKKSK
jgi:uncharacterized membrane protein YqaE (UPF0057 family)